MKLTTWSSEVRAEPIFGFGGHISGTPVPHIYSAELNLKFQLEHENGYEEMSRLIDALLRLYGPNAVGEPLCGL